MFQTFFKSYFLIIIYDIKSSIQPDTGYQKDRMSGRGRTDIGKALSPPPPIFLINGEGPSLSSISLPLSPLHKYCLSFPEFSLFSLFFHLPFCLLGGEANNFFWWGVRGEGWGVNPFFAFHSPCQFLCSGPSLSESTAGSYIGT